MLDQLYFDLKFFLNLIIYYLFNNEFFMLFVNVNVIFELVIVLCNA